MARTKPQLLLRRGDVTNAKMVAGNERRFTRVVVDGRVKCWVGIGWVDEGDPTPAQLRSLPLVVERIR